MAMQCHNIICSTLHCQHGNIIFQIDLRNLPYLTLGVTSGVTRSYLSSTADAISDELQIPEGFPFGSSRQTSVYVSACCWQLQQYL